VTKKSGKIAERIAAFQGDGLDAHYLGFFDCFNRQLYYEAHDVLEELWLADRRGTDGDFFKGLIQLAGAFVHLQKNRLHPAAALFKLARANLVKYPSLYWQLDVAVVLQLIEVWLDWLEADGFSKNPFPSRGLPELVLLAR
jgi:predicted metal-dependent hydrolase